MASVTSRQGLIDYCLRRLGQPVVEINVDEDQLEERVDDALEYFQEYHFDGVEKVFTKHEITAGNIENEYVNTDDSIISVVRVLPIPSFDSFFSGSSLIQWSMSLRNFAEIEQLFQIAPQMHWNRKQDRIYLETDWADKFTAGDILVIEAYKILDPSTWPQVWNDMFLKQYATALIKRQWGENLKKFTGVQLPGGISLDGKTIYDEAVEELRAIEEQVSLRYELPADGFIG